jgi:hypothetical protein
MQATNIFFYKIIKINDRLREFNFRKLPNTNNNFHVDVTDDRGQRLMFTMYQDMEKAWRIAATSIPLWVHSAEDRLGEVIEFETKSLGLRRH